MTSQKRARSPVAASRRRSMIPDVKTYRVIDLSSRRAIGTLDEWFVAENAKLGESFIMRGSAWRFVDFKEDHLLVEPVREIGDVPSWVGEDIPVPFDVAQEVGRIRRERDLSAYPVNEHGASTFLGYLASVGDAPLATDTRITIESARDVLIVNACFGSKVNETLAQLISSLISARFGQSVGVQTDPYRVVLEVPRSVNPQQVVEILRPEDPDAHDADREGGPRGRAPPRDAVPGRPRDPHGRQGAPGEGDGDVPVPELQDVLAGRRARPARENPMSEVRGAHGGRHSPVREGQDREARSAGDGQGESGEGEAAVHECEPGDGAREEGRPRADGPRRRRGYRRSDPSRISRERTRLLAGRPGGGNHVRPDEAVLGLASLGPGGQHPSMVSLGEPKTIRLLEGGLVLRDGPIVERPDERFVPRLRALQRRRCDRMRSVRFRPEQSVAGRESGRHPRRLARPVEGADGRGETGTAARPGGARRRRGRRGGVVRLPPGRDPTIAIGGAARGPFCLRGSRRDSTDAGSVNGRGTDSGPRHARGNRRPKDDPDLRADVRRGDIRVRGRVGCRVHLLPHVREPVRPVRALADRLVRRDRRGRDARGAPAVPSLEQRGGPGRSPRQTGAVPGGVGALRAGDPAGPPTVVRMYLARGRDAVPLQ